MSLFLLSLEYELPVGFFPFAEHLLREESVGLASLRFRLDAPVHFSLLFLDLAELILDVLVFSLGGERVLLHLELVGEHLVLAAGLGPLLLPALHALALPVQHLLVQRVQLLPRLPPVLLRLLLLQLLQ